MRGEAIFRQAALLHMDHPVKKRGLQENVLAAHGYVACSQVRISQKVQKNVALCLSVSRSVPWNGKEVN
jgi:hypothetical protein